MEKDLQKQLNTIALGTEDILVGEELKNKLKNSIKSGKPLRIKLGLDPTAPDIHLGHTVVLNKLRQFQDLGHKAILIIGDYTARIGDPSGRSSLRPKLSGKVIDRNAETYMKQAFKILDPDKIEVVKNSQWLKPLKFEDILNLTSQFTVARMLERDDFKKRFKNNISIAIIEFLYPVMQAYDSVAVKADVELGGTDQRFNLIMGRELQRDFSQIPQIAITTPILTGTDGVEKMSKSTGNYIGVSESPGEIFGKVMSIPDSIMMDYFKLVTRLGHEEVAEIEKSISKQDLNPSIAKRRLARLIISNLYDEDEAAGAEDSFDRLFKQKKTPDDIEEFVISKDLIVDGELKLFIAMAASGLAKSNSEARRLIGQGAVRVDGSRVSDTEFGQDPGKWHGKIIQKGKRHFRKLINKK